MFDRCVSDEPTERLEAELFSIAGHLAAGEARFLTILAELDRRRAWASWGAKDGVQWLGWRLGIGAHAARERLRVAHALDALPAIAAVFARGELSYSQVRAITRVAGPHNETAMISCAKAMTAAQLDKVVAGIVRADAASDAGFAKAQFDARAYRRSIDYDRDLVVSRFALPPEQARVVEAALDKMAAGLRAERGTNDPTTREQLLADALVAMAEHVLAGGTELAQAAAPRTFHVVVHADAAVVADRDTAGDAPRAHLEGGLAVTAETVRRIWCDTAATNVIDHDGKVVIASGPDTQIPAWVRRAVKLRDKTCRFPGCSAKLGDIHHVVRRRRGGSHEPANLAFLCRHHHRLLHEGGFRVERGVDGSLRFFNPAGLPIDPEPALRRGSTTGLARAHRAAITPQTAETRLEELRDHPYVVSVLCRPLRHVPAWT